VRPDVVGLGISTIDHLYLFKDLSALPGGVVLDYSFEGGGVAATAMAAAATLGASCGIITPVGDDARGKEIIARFRACGVDTSQHALRRGFVSCMVLVMVDARTGDRHFLGLKGEFPKLKPSEINWDYVAGARIVHCDPFVEQLGAVLEKARSLDLTTTMDADLQSGLEADWVPLVNVFIGSGDDPAWRQQPERALAAARRIAERGPQTAILTLGAAGCVGVSPDGSFSIPAYKVDVVDTTGTGDVFHGAYIYALTLGWQAEAGARFASAAAAISATKLGGRAALASADEVAAFLDSHGDHGPWAGAPKL